MKNYTKPILKDEGNVASITLDGPLGYWWKLLFGPGGRCGGGYDNAS